MKRVYETKLRQVKSPAVEDKEQLAINDMFVDEDEDDSSSNVSIKADALNEVIDSFDAEVYDDLTEEITGNAWREKAEQFAYAMRDHVVTTMAFFDATKSVEEHFKREMHSSIAILDADMVKSITYLLRLKLFNIAADDMGFTPEEAEILFFKEVEGLKGKGPIKSLVNFLKNTGAEESPYGDTTNPIGMSRKRKNNEA